MAILSNLNTRAKLMLSFGVISLVILTITIQSYFKVSTIRDSDEKLIQTMGLAKNMAELRSDQNTIRSLSFELMIAKEEKHTAETREQMQEQAKLIDDRMAGIEKNWLHFLPS